MTPCHGCGALRARFGVASCKVVQLCKRFDRQLTVLAPGRTLAEYESLHGTLSGGYLRAERRIASGDDFLLSAPLPDALRTLHGLIVRPALPDIGGRFRRTDEPVYVDEGAHQFEGAGADEIEQALSRLERRLRAAEGAPDDPHALALWSAELLQGVFAIHPFVDVNGRTARLYLTARAFPRRHAFAWDSSAASRRTYRYALRYAHARMGVTEGERRSCRDPDGAFIPLARWLERQIRSTQEPTDPSG